MATVVLKSNEGPVSFSYDLPNGKKKVIEFKPKEQDGPCVAEVPVELDYIDDFKVKHRFHDNYAQHLLNSYKFLEIVSVTETPVVAVAKVEEPRRKKGKQT